MKNTPARKAAKELFIYTAVIPAITLFMQHFVGTVVAFFAGWITAYFVSIFTANTHKIIADEDDE